jgi:hypothetical protein
MNSKITIMQEIAENMESINREMMSTVASILDGVGIGRKVTCFTKVVVGA